MFSQISTISKFTIIESIRNRLLWLSLLVVAVSFGLVEFIGDLAITEHRVTQVAVLAAFLRLSAVVIVTMFAAITFDPRILWDSCANVEEKREIKLFYII